MLNIIKARTPILAIILSLVAISYTFASNKVVVVPMFDDVAASAVLPRGTIIGFNGSVCPTGWNRYDAADNRFMIGSSTNTGNLGGDDTHQHTWSFFHYSGLDWYSWDETGLFTKSMINWGDGMGDTGGGLYPIAVHQQATSDQEYYTKLSSHMPPYIKMLFCEKV